MGVRLEVILVAIAIKVERQLFGLFRRHTTHIAHIFGRFTVGFLLSSGTGIGKPLLHIVDLRIEETVAAYQSRVEHTQRSHRLEAFVGLCHFQRIASSAADAEDTDTVGIHTGILRQNVGRAADVLHTVGWFVHVARLTLASTLVGGIKGQADVALFRHALAVKSCHLLLAATVGMRYDQGRIAL